MVELRYRESLWRIDSMHWNKLGLFQPHTFLKFLFLVSIL